MSVKPCSSNNRPTGSAWSPPSSSRSQPPGRSHRGALRTTSASRSVPSVPPSRARRGSNAWTSRGSRRSASVGTYGTTAVMTSTVPSSTAGSGSSKDPSNTSTWLRRAHRAAIGSSSVATTRARGLAAAITAAIAPAPVHRSTATPRGREQRGRAPSQRFGLHPRDVDARLHDERDVSERDGARQPGERFAFGAPGDDRRKDVAIAGCRADQFVGFFGGGDAARLGQEGGDGLTVERLRWIHAGTVVVALPSGPQEVNGSNAQVVRKAGYRTQERCGRVCRPCASPPKPTSPPG